MNLFLGANLELKLLINQKWGGEFSSFFDILLATYFGNISVSFIEKIDLGKTKT